MPIDSVARVIGNIFLQIALLPFNFIVWLVTSPELITLLCILSEILIELVVSAVMAGVSIIVSAVILMEDDPEPTLIMTPPSHPKAKKSFLHGGDPTCITISEQAKDMKEHGDQTGDSAEERKSQTGVRKSQTGDSAEDRNGRRRSSSALDRWLPKYGTPRGDTTRPAPANIEMPLTEGSEPESLYVTQDSGETRTDEAGSVKSAEFDDKPFKDVVESLQVAGDGTSDIEKVADSVIADIENAVNDNERTADTDSVKVDGENAITMLPEAVQERLSVKSNKSEK